MSIKKFINYLTAFAMLFSLGVFPALAEEQRESVTEKFSAQKERTKQKTEETRKVRVRAYLGRVAGRTGIAITRLERIADRIDSRLDKLQEKGTDVSDYRTLLETAETKITGAKLDAENAKIKIEEMMNSGEDAKTIFQQIKDELNKVKQAVKGAHSALVDVIAAIKPGLIKK